MQSFISASANELDQHDDSESLEDEILNINPGDSPSSSDDDDANANIPSNMSGMVRRNSNNSNLILAPGNAEINARILIGGSGTNTPR